MPKTKYLMSAGQKQADSLEAKTKKFSDDIRGAVGEVRGRLDLTQGEFAKMAGLNASTFSKRLKNPKDFEASDFLKMIVAFPQIREKLIASLEQL